jgi:hypothetical protein
VGFNTQVGCNLPDVVVNFWKQRNVARTFPWLKFGRTCVQEPSFAA